MSPQVRAEVFRGISLLLRSQRLDPGKFYHSINLPANIEEEPDKLQPFQTFTATLKALKTLTHQELIGMELAKIQYKNGLQSAYLHLMYHSPSIGAALSFAERFRHIYSEVTHWSGSMENGYLFVKRGSYVPLNDNDREHSLYALCVCYFIAERIHGPHWKPTYISLIQPPVQEKQQLESFFGCEVRYSQSFDGFVSVSDDLYRRAHQFDSECYGRLLTLLSRSKSVFPQTLECDAMVRGLIQNTLESGLCNLNQIAHMLELHPRALQKRLAKKHLTFKQLVLEVRMVAAERLLLQEDIPITQITCILGYSEPSAFNHAFKSHFDLSPQQWRQTFCGTAEDLSVTS